MKMSFWPFVMCQVDTSESLEDIFPGGLINRGKNLAIHQRVIKVAGEV